MNITRLQQQTRKICYVFSLLSILITSATDISFASEPAEITSIPALLKCVAFSPYINDYDPNQPNNAAKVPPTSVIDTLLDAIVLQGYNCIMTYGVHPPLDHIFPAAQARGLKVFANVWLEPGVSYTIQNATSIQDGIDAALTYSDTIVRLSCGVEVRNRAINNGLPVSAAETVITDCITQLRAADVTQPITTIDTWWNWCNAQSPCQSWGMVNNVDWIGINVYPWWENKYSGLYTCIPAVDAPQFHIDRIADVQEVYPSKIVVLTEFGWPAGPNGYTETNLYNSNKCGIASEANQDFVISETLKKLNNAGIQGVVFEGFQEPWKTVEGPVGPFWGTITPTFGDVPFTHMFWKYIEVFYQAGITTGCTQSPKKFCPLNNVTRGEMAVFLERAMGNFTPAPDPTGMFADVPYLGQPASFQAFIEEFYNDGITTGCSTNPLKYCPQNYVTRGEMAVFIERALGNFSPTPSQTGMFADVPNLNQPASFQAFIEQFYLDGITTGCATNPLRYCPMNKVTRQEMAVFIVRAFGIPLP